MVPISKYLRENLFLLNFPLFLNRYPWVIHLYYLGNCHTWCLSFQRKNNPVEYNGHWTKKVLLEEHYKLRTPISTRSLIKRNVWMMSASSLAFSVVLKLFTVNVQRMWNYSQWIIEMAKARRKGQNRDLSRSEFYCLVEVHLLELLICKGSRYFPKQCCYCKKITFSQHSNRSIFLKLGKYSFPCCSRTLTPHHSIASQSMLHRHFAP